MIPDQDKTKEQLIAELAELRQQVNPARQTKAEQALRDSEHRFSSITRTTSDAVLITDESGKIIFCNLAAEKIFGYAAEELHGKSSDILRP
jgi:PAS domain-containing protein